MKKVKKNSLLNIATLLFGTTLVALSFNLFLMPNNIISGVSGLSVIANNLLNIKPSLFIMICYIIILIFSFIFLGFENTKKSIIGSILYPIMVELTSYAVPYIDVSGVEVIVIAVCGALVGGFGSGLVYKVGYSTGGSDVINQLLSKFLKKPIGTCTLITNGIIISLGFLTFGLNTVIYSIIVVYISSFIIDKVMIGISASKTFKIITQHETEVKKFLTTKLSHGVTVLEGRGGYTGNMLKVIMCVVPTGEYMVVKEAVLQIDPDALIMVSDVYEVLGNK